MDIQYLIWLQVLRVNLGEGVEKFFTIFSDTSVNITLTASAIIFWCVNKRAGKFLMLVLAFGRLVNQCLKNTFCVYRPWILNLDLHPTASALGSIGSYSFPSGHTNMATAFYGGIAYFYRKKYPLLIIPCVLTVLAVAFSRNFLGVHTPQDVLVSIIETVLAMIIVDKLMNLIDEGRENLVVIGSIILGMIVTAYLVLKSYPVDYYNGKVIVDPIRAIRDGTGSMGTFFGVVIGLAMESRFVKFNADVKLATKIFRIILGMALIQVCMLLITPAISATFDKVSAKFLGWFVTTFTMTFFIPFLFMKIENKFFR